MEETIAEEWAPAETDAGEATAMEGVQESAAPDEAASQVQAEEAGKAEEQEGPEVQPAVGFKRRRNVQKTPAADGAEVPVQAQRGRRPAKAAAAAGDADAEGAAAEEAGAEQGEVEEAPPAKRARGRAPKPKAASAPSERVVAAPTRSAHAKSGPASAAAGKGPVAEGVLPKTRTRGGGGKRAAEGAPAEAPAPKQATRKRSRKE